MECSPWHGDDTEKASLRDLAISLAEEAGELVRRRLLLPRDRVEHKVSVNDIATEVDHDAEALIVDRLSRLRPDDGILAEEDHASASRSGLTWVIDPLDGSANYLHRTRRLESRSRSAPRWPAGRRPCRSGAARRRAPRDVLGCRRLWCDPQRPGARPERRTTAHDGNRRHGVLPRRPGASRGGRAPADPAPRHRRPPTERLRRDRPLLVSRAAKR
jgi:hypothetical protein